MIKAKIYAKNLVKEKKIKGNGKEKIKAKSFIKQFEAKNNAESGAKILNLCLRENNPKLKIIKAKYSKILVQGCILTSIKFKLKSKKKI